MRLGKRESTVARRKVVLIIVEGPSDAEALEVVLTKLYSKNKIHVHIKFGDITSERETNSGNILAKLGEILKKCKEKYNLREDDFHEIIHIVDMDGAFISDDAIVEDEVADRPIYSLMDIRTSDVHGITCRNERKRKCLNKISSTRTLSGIPYQVYFMSCNLDHVLYDKLNSTDEEKEKDALCFAKKYRSNIPEFVTFISNSSFTVKGSYLDSWAFIKEEKRSLERFTNLRVCIERAQESLASEKIQKSSEG